MPFRTLDINDDWTFGNGIQSYSTGLDALKLNIKTRLRTWLGECFFDKGAGVDWNNYLDIGTKIFLDLNIQKVILQSDGVLSIDEYNSEILERDLQVSSTILTIYGTISLQESLLNA